MEEESGYQRMAKGSHSGKESEEVLEPLGPLFSDLFVLVAGASGKEGPGLLATHEGVGGQSRMTTAEKGSRVLFAGHAASQTSGPAPPWRKSTHLSGALAAVRRPVGDQQSVSVPSTDGISSLPSLLVLL